MVTAKFRCTEIKQKIGMNLYTLEAVTTGPGNETWSKFTPSGKMEMYITNPNASFALGKDYLVEFSEFNN